MTANKHKRERNASFLIQIKISGTGGAIISSGGASGDLTNTYIHTYIYDTVNE